jgi:hypothetical protein
MRLIGAGLPRTATLTQKVALEMLGLKPCYHMVDVFADLSQADRWRAAFDGQISAAEILEGHPAMVDWPGSYYYKELMEAFPDAKVLLSTRSPESWAKSMRDTIWPCLYGDSLMRHMSEARRRVDRGWDVNMGMLDEMWTRSGLLNGEETTDEWMIDAFRRHHEEVVATVPAEKLLVWSPKDGWEPLCAHLEVPVPDFPVPHINDTKEFGERIIDGALIAVQEYRKAQAEEAVPA